MKLISCRSVAVRCRPLAIAVATATGGAGATVLLDVFLYSYI